MSVKINNEDIADVRIGDSQISSIYAGDVLIWSAEPTDAILVISDTNTPYKVSIDYNPVEITKFYQNDDGTYRSHIKISNDSIFNNFATGNSYVQTLKNAGVKKIIFDTSKQYNQFNDSFFLSLDEFYLDGHYQEIKAIRSPFVWGTTIKKCTFKNFSLINASNMLGTGYSTINYPELNIDNVDLSKCKDISYIFAGVRTDSDLDSIVSNIKVTDVCTSAQYAFNNVLALVNPDISNFDLSNANNLSFLFADCGNLETIGNVIWEGEKSRCSSMFYNCNKLTNAGDFSNMTLNNAYCASIFQGCSSLNSPITLKGSTVDAGAMFYGCTNLTDIDLSNLTFNNASIWSAFRESGVQSIVLNGSTQNASYMCYNCPNLENVDLNNMTLNNANCGVMFMGCSSLTGSITLKGSISNAANMFNGCTNLTDIDISNVDFSNCTNMAGMFQNCKLNNTFEFSLTDKNLPNLTSISVMFSRRGMPKIKKLNLSNNTWRNEGVDCSQLFRWCDCETVDLRGVIPSTNVSLAFSECNIDTLDIRNFDTKLCTNLYGAFAGSVETLLFDSAFLNSNVATIPLYGFFNHTTIDRLNELFDILKNHPKTLDEDWEGQTISLGLLISQTDNKGILNRNGLYPNWELISKMDECGNLGWMFSA